MIVASIKIIFIRLFYSNSELMSSSWAVGVYRKKFAGRFFVCVRLESAEVWSCKGDVNNKVSF